MSSDKLSFHGVPDEFTHGQVKVKCPYPVQMIQELEITRKLNQHGQVTVKGILWEEKGRDCIHQAKSQDPITVYADNGSGETVLFSGVITEAEVSYRDQVYYVEIKGASWSSLLDYEEKNRSFQNKQMSYSALLEQVLSTYPGSTFINSTDFPRQKTGQFILQYRETDWEFCKRLASHFQTQLVADVTGQAPGFSFGLPKNNAKLKSAGEVVTSRDSGEYHRASATGAWVQEDQFVKYHIRSRERLELGDAVKYKGRTMVIEESRMFLSKGVLCYTYVLGLEASLNIPMQVNPRIRGVSLLGKVLESKNQKVKLKLDIDREQDATTACWFPYASQANNLFYCMPETGTTLSLYFSDCDETGGIAMNAVRKNGGSCAKTSNPALKYMGIPAGKEFKLGTTDINFEAHDSLFMKMDAGSGVSVQSHKDLNIFTKQKLLMEAKELVRVFAKTGNIIAGAKEESSLYLLGGADGDAHIKAGNNLFYEGRKKEIFTDRLNEEIKYEEKKMDWGKLVKNVLIGLAVVAAVVAVVALTGGSGAAIVGAAICGTMSVATTAISDIRRGEVSDWQDYAMAGFKGAIEGAISGAILGVLPMESASLLSHMLVSGGVSFLTDAISQGIDYLYYGKSYDWKQGLLSFGIGFLMPAVAAGMRKGLNTLLKKFGKSMPGWLKKVFCKLCGEPVDAVTGNVVYDTVDFELPGPLPLQWQRIWCSASRVKGHLGYGTRFSYEMGLEILEEGVAVAVFLNDGRVCSFPDILAGEEVFSDESGLLLRRMEDYYELFDPESRYSYLLYPSPGGYLPYKLARIQNPQGHRIQFFYDGNGWLCGIKDSAGRDLDVTTSHEGRITKVALQDDSGMESHVLVRYAYNKEQDLETVTDAAGADTCLKYRNHLLVQKTDRNRNSFYWEYDRYEDGARAVRTWGDGDVFSLWFDYHDENNYNTVRTSPEGLPTEYHYNDKKLCTRTVYPDLTETRENYNERWQLESRVDEEGRITQYQYNDWSQITGVTFADASKILLSYDEKGRLSEMTDPEGSTGKWIYNEDDTLDRTVDETGAETIYQYNQYRLAEKVIYPNKGEVRLEYDRHFNLSRVTLPDGSSSSWEYDQRGNCLTEKNPLGAVTAYQYDAMDRMVRAKLPDGNDVRLSYDGYRDVLHAEDNRTKVDFTYTILGSITSRTQGDHRTAYAYNSQEELVSVTNEKGEVYRFERDAKGNIIREESFDGQVRTYELDYSGLVTRINRPGGRFTSYRYDRLGRVTRAEYQDKSYEAFTYNKNGALTAAENQDTRIRLERDCVGRITREWQDSHWVSSKYDEMGNRIQTASSFGADICASRNETGQITRLTACTGRELQWAAGMEYNALGQETRRIYPGGVCSSWEYDSTGRPVFHEVTGRRGNSGTIGLSGRRVSGSTEETLRRRRYKWDINCQLKEVANELSKGTTVFSYDQFGNLASARESGFETIFRTADTAGNLYETADYSDRIYGTGSRLEQSRIDLKEKRNRYQGGHGKLVTRGVEFLYDEEGNLVKKTEPDGRTWTYTYSGNGMLAEVTRPDRSCVRFKYDALGRRTEKTVTGGYSGSVSGKQNEKVVKFLWDGNTPLHEWEEERTTDSIPVPRPVADYKADFLVKLEKRAEEKARKEAEKGQEPPENLITWIFEDDFVPRAKITRDGCYSIISDHLGTPVEAYAGEDGKVWERELDIYGRVKTGRNETGERNFIPFRFQGQYEDGETGLYYNRFRYYSPEEGCYTQQDPIGLAGGTNLYSYVKSTNCQIDIWGWEDIVYRALNREDVQNIINGDGLIPKDPSAHATVIDHVTHGSDPGYEDQYISFTRNERFANRWAKNSNTGVVSVDLDTIQNTKIDLSTAEGRIANIGDAGKAAPNSPVHQANKWAKGADEVLVEGKIPNSKIGNGKGADAIKRCRG